MKKIIKLIYKFIPFKRFIFSGLRLFKPKESLYQHLYFYDSFKVKVDDLHSFKLFHHGLQIENNIFWEGLYGKYERASMKLWSEICKKSNVIFDVGANTGVFAMTARAANPESTVYAFEPIKRVYDKLVLNNSINNFNVNCLNIALSEKCGKVMVFDQPHTHETTVSLERNVLEHEENSQLVEIERVDLSSFIETNQIKQIDLIKLDVEYHEYAVLKGMGQYLEFFRPNILIEIVDNEIALKIGNLIEKLNYLIYDINEQQYSIRKIDKIARSTHQNLLLYRKEDEENLVTSLKNVIPIL